MYYQLVQWSVRVQGITNTRKREKLKKKKWNEQIHLDEM